MSTSPDSILASSLKGPFEVLADSARLPDNTAQLLALLKFLGEPRAG
jgi:hypothetical protein